MHGLSSEPAPQGVGSIRVWDPIVRVFHWTVVLGCVVDLFILTDGGLVHQAFGYVIAAFLAIRVAWGFVGTGYARFADFAPSPRRLAGYLGDLARGREQRHIGHNPAGAVMMLALMALLAGVCVTGWMQGLDRFWGVEWVMTLHDGFADAILVLALLHAGAALVESWRHRENLVLSMVTGRKRP